MSNFNGPQSIDRKDRIPSPSGSTSSRGNVVDHDAPHGMHLPHTLHLQIEGSTSVVTEDRPPAGRVGAGGKSHMIVVQPLKRSEMQVRHNA
jgi:erythrocyte band 7 integral membrane protein